MKSLTILEAPNKILSAVARPVEENEFNQDLIQFCDLMVTAMKEANGVGLAAPQVGDSRRIIVAEPRAGAEEPVELYKMINPEIYYRSEEMIACEEGCLSVPRFMLSVPRNATISVRWWTPEKKLEHQVFAGFPSIVIQHEIDHLDGITLLDKTSKFKKSRYLRKKRKKSRKKRAI